MIVLAWMLGFKNGVCQQACSFSLAAWQQVCEHAICVCNPPMSPGGSQASPGEGVSPCNIGQPGQPQQGMGAWQASAPLTQHSWQEALCYGVAQMLSQETRSVASALC